MLLTGAWDARFHIGGAGRGAKVKDFSYVEASDQDGGIRPRLHGRLSMWSHLDFSVLTFYENMNSSSSWYGGCELGWGKTVNIDTP
jgi:hypothetical protein